jgi:hypothetical protein
MKKLSASMLAFSVLAACLVASAVYAADNSKVVGTWALELMFEGQKQAITLEIKTKEDGSLTGTWVGPHRTNELVDFTWDGTTLTFTRNVNREGTPVALKHKATVEGDAMKGTITAPEGEVPFTAARKKAT